MNKERGFTLTEVLLAVLVVGLIGIALASLTTAASRESGVGRSRVMLRNSMSRAIKQLRQDVHDSSRVLYVRNRIASVNGTTMIPLLLLGQNLRIDGTAVPGQTVSYVVYCFKPGTITTTASGAAVEPTTAHSGAAQAATDGGTIYRRVSSTLASNEQQTGIPSCTDTAADIFLENVKFIPPVSSTSSEYYYPVPLFAAVGSETSSTAYNAKTATDLSLEGRLKVNFILELHSSPVVNDAADEEFVLPVGYSDPRT